MINFQSVLGAGSRFLCNRSPNFGVGSQDGGVGSGIWWDPAEFNPLRDATNFVERELEVLSVLKPRVWILVWVLLTYKSRLHRCCDVRKPAQKSVAQLIATIAKHDLPDNRWPALFQFLEQHVRSDNAVHREVPPFPFTVTAYLGNFGNPFKVNIVDKQPDNCLGILLKFFENL